ncbi:MAG: hypothetical protein NUV77_25505, partial [Thermoguttaceae bacterium]|nr:hypothetical protein [Thermoguttaceae bacterium]
RAIVEFLQRAGGGHVPARVAAARALAELKREGLEEPARRLASDASPAHLPDRLVAARLLRRHGSPAALELLTALAQDREPAIAAAALEPLVERDFRRVLPISDPLLANDDANVRRLAARAWVAERTAAAVGRLGKLLDDPHPDVRAYVRESLLAMTSEAPLRDAVLEEARRALAGRQWRALEQSVMILVALDRKEVADRLVELLEFDRPEVYIAAGWGLRRLAVESTRPAMLRKVQRIHDVQKSVGTAWEVDQQFCHLVEALGLLRADEALPLLRQYVPKDFAIRPSARATAIWAIGHILADKPDPALVAQLCERVSDIMSLMPEASEVRAMSAVTLGRMRAKDALDTLRKLAGGREVGDPSQFACGWAIHQITGEPLPVFVPFKLTRSAWFLEPLK